MTTQSVPNSTPETFDQLLPYLGVTTPSAVSVGRAVGSGSGNFSIAAANARRLAENPQYFAKTRKRIVGISRALHDEAIARGCAGPPRAFFAGVNGGFPLAAVPSTPLAPPAPPLVYPGIIAGSTIGEAICWAQIVDGNATGPAGTGGPLGEGAGRTVPAVPRPPSPRPSEARVEPASGLVCPACGLRFQPDISIQITGPNTVRYDGLTAHCPDCCKRANEEAAPTIVQGLAVQGERGPGDAPPESGVYLIGCDGTSGKDLDDE